MIPISDDNPRYGEVPTITIGLIIACAIVFVYELSLLERAEAFIHGFGFIPDNLLGDASGKPQPIPSLFTIFTSMFLHAGFWHIISNMLYLWIFGDNVELAMGKAKFIAFYILTGVIAALSQGFIDPESTIPMVGASGAVSGILGAYLLLYPKANVRMIVFFGIFWRILNIPAMWVLGFWFLMQSTYIFMIDTSQGGTAFGAHIGGFIAGMILIPFFKNKEVALFHKPTHKPWSGEEWHGPWEKPQGERPMHGPWNIDRQRKRNTWDPGDYEEDDNKRFRGPWDRP